MAAVGNLPGVPALLTGFSAALSLTQNPIVQDVLSGLGLAQIPQWGIYSLGGVPVITSDTVVDLSYKKDSVIADYPIEQGGFIAYDKVATPFEARIRFVAGGSTANQNALLSSIEAIAGDTNLYDVTTPIWTYQNCNVRHCDYHRTVTNGLGVLAVDVWLSEIRIVAPASLSGASPSTVSPSGAGGTTPGAVQATPATTSQQSAGTGAWTAGLE